MATIPVPTDPAEALELAQQLLAEHGPTNVSTRSEGGAGLVYVVPDAEPEPKKAPVKKPAAAGAAAAD